MDPLALLQDDDDDIVAAMNDLDNAVAATLLLLKRRQNRKAKTRKGSTPGRMKSRPRNSALGHESIMRDYLGPAPVYDEPLFQRRYRIPSALFRRLLHDLQEHNAYFQQKPDAAGKMGISPEQKMTAALRMLAQGTAGDAQDEYCRIGETTALDSFHAFCRGVVEVYGDEYLRAPTEADCARILAFNERRGMPGLMGSLDCTHWRWKNCPTAWHGQYKGKEGAPTVVLEAVASADRWIWHAFFGIPGSNNDLNVLDRSPLLHQIVNGTQPTICYKLGDVEFTQPYYFVDGIYPEWTSFVSAFTVPDQRSKKNFTKAHEAIRKEIECAFGMLKARFGVLSQPSRMWSDVKMKYVISCCIILHNMIIEHRGAGIPESFPDAFGNEACNTTDSVEISETEPATNGESPFSHIVSASDAIQNTQSKR